MSSEALNRYLLIDAIKNIICTIDSDASSCFPSQIATAGPGRNWGRSRIMISVVAVWMSFITIVTCILILSNYVYALVNWVDLFTVSARALFTKDPF